MRFAWVVIVTGFLVGCAGGLAERQAELTQWVGQTSTVAVGVVKSFSLWGNGCG
jgi:hypothetical protein